MVSLLPHRRWYAFRWRVVGLVLMLILSVFGYVGWRIYWVLQPRPMGSGPAGPTPDASRFEQPWRQGKVFVLALGDSITRGYGATRSSNYVSMVIRNDDEMYPDMKGLDLQAVLPQMESKNVAVDFTTTEDHLVRQLPKIETFGPDVFGIVLITSGGNDLIHDYGRSTPRDGAMYGCTIEQGRVWTAKVQDRLRQILQSVMARFPGGCEIFLANLYDPTDGVGDPQSFGLPRWPDSMRVLDEMNRCILTLCGEYPNVHLVDIHTPFLGHGIHCRDWWRKTYRLDDPTWWYSPNLEDPNVRGHDAIRRCFLEQMIQVLVPKRETNNHLVQ